MNNVTPLRSSVYHPTAKLDSGASHIYFKNTYAYLLHQLEIIRKGPKAQLPNKDVIQDDRKGKVPVHEYLTK